MEAISEVWNERTVSLLGKQAFDKLQKAHVWIAGVGGVGAYTAEMLIRAGVGRLTLVDNDTIKPSNLNRQLPATTQSLGCHKVDVMQERLLSICPNATITTLPIYLDESNIDQLLKQAKPDFVADAIDTIAPKIALDAYCIQHQIPIIASMGAGGRTDPSRIHYADISQTAYCALARTVRTRLKAIGIYKGLPVVYSDEVINKSSLVTVNESNKRSTLGTVSYLPALFGCWMAAWIIKKITEQ